jgi:hypothetical protein
MGSEAVASAGNPPLTIKASDAKVMPQAMAFFCAVFAIGRFYRQA